jgi:hypothetical protein
MMSLEPGLASVTPAAPASEPASGAANRTAKF